MKRFFSIILCLLLIASLAACADEKATESPATDNTKATVIPSTPENTEENSPLFGEYYGNSYNNTLLNIGISFPTDWILTPTKEIAKMNGIDEQEMLKDFETFMKDKELGYILQATDPTGVSKVNLTLENLALSGNSNITGTQYIELFKDSIKETLMDSGAANIILTPTSVQLGGRTYTVLTRSYMVDKMPFYQEQILFPLGNYMGILTLTGDTETILSRTYTLE
ncbi:MAG: hypothetical protein IJA62_06180 [Ruminococcus sp.]|nr:hypothetical protein [Ruminococcus sp.]